MEALQALGSLPVNSSGSDLVTCNSNEIPSQMQNSKGNMEALHALGSLPINSSGSDLDSIDDVPLPVNTQLVSYMSTYQKRQAFGMYLNPLFSSFLFCLLFR